MTNCFNDIFTFIRDTKDYHCHAQEERFMGKAVYLHIGMPKTGTSSLQLFCEKNREILKEKGYCYPNIPLRYLDASRTRNAHFLVGNIFRKSGEPDTEATNRQREQGYRYIKEQFEQYDYIVLSDEGIWKCLKTSPRNIIGEVNDFCRAYSYQLKVIVYLRRQDDFLESYWKQKVRRRGATRTWKSFLKNTPSYVILDYYEHLKKISDVVGIENVIVRCYEKERFSGGSIYSDFLDVIGLELDEKFVPLEKPVNLSLSNNYAEIKRIMNKLLSDNWEVRHKENEWLEQVAAACSRQQTDSAKTSMFSQAERKKFMKKYEKSNQKVAQEFLGEQELFREDVEDLPKWVKENQRQYEDSLLFFGMALLRQEKEIEQIKNMIREERGGVLRKAKQFIKYHA
jgi:hypothetical protein